MKKILAIVLVIAMVLIPVSALAETVIAPGTNVTLSGQLADGTEVKGVSATYFNADGTAAILASGSTVYAKIAAPKDYVVVDVTLGGTSLVPDAGTAGAKVKGFYALALGATDSNEVVVTVEKNAFAITAGIITKEDDTAFVKGFGSVSASGSTYTANVLNAYFGGEWYIATDTAFVALLNTAFAPKYTAPAASIAIDVAAIKAEAGNKAVKIAALVYPTIGTITGNVDTINKYGKVNVHWLSKNSAKITAIPDKGAKFIGWTWETISLAATGVPAWDSNDPVIYVKDLQNTDNVSVTAYFIKTAGGDFTTGTTDTRANGDNPKTGDNSNVALWTIVGIIALGGVALASKKVFSK